MFVLFVLALYLAPSFQQSVIGTVLQSHSTLLFESIEFYWFKGVPKLPELNIDEKREAYRYQQTLVIRYSEKDDDTVRYCELIEIYDEDLIKNIYNTLSLLFNLEVQKVTMDEIFRFMEDCDKIEEKSSEKREGHGPNSIVNGIFPGTKWCGFGDIARSYHDLAGNRNVDRCCRAHDYCPLKVYGKDEKFSLKNQAKYTISHCSCDEAFYACLKKDHGFAAKIIQNLYFGIAHPKCFRGMPENQDENMELSEARISEW